MLRRHLRASRVSVSPRGDDFALIKGIGPAFKTRLQHAGILTFAQLGASTPEEVADAVTGLSAKRIAKENWIGQARKLTSERAPAKPRKKVTAPKGRQHYATFTVELLLDERNDVRRTRIAHVQTGEEDTWAGWQEDQLVGFFVERAELHLASVEPHPQPAAMAERIPPSPATVGLTGILRLRDLETVPTGTDSPTHILRHDQPFVVHLTLDLTKVVAPSNVPLAYKATICAKKLGGPRQLAGEAYEFMKLAQTVTVNVAGTALPQGTYRLEAIVTLTLSLAEPLPQAGLMAMLEGGLLQIY
jgi:hypothetical protein